MVSAVGATQSTPLPSWIEHSGNVLRFYAFFEEPVPASAEESWRVRRVVIYHYLEDGTTQVEESRQGDGLVQGTLTRRMRIPRQYVSTQDPAMETQTDFLDWKDFEVGRCIDIYGRKLHIVDADNFTRDHLAAIGKPQAPPQPVPQSPIDVYRAEKSKPSGLSRTDPQSPSRFAEALLGRAPSTKKLQQFLEGNSRVLRFFAIWDDATTTEPGARPMRRPYKILYYLEDDTLEIMELRDGNGGREFYRFLSRARLPKSPGITPLGAELDPGDCLRPTDLCIGATVTVHGRQFFIHDADQFTKEWLRGVVGWPPEQLLPLDVSQPKPHLPVPQLPPHNGFGDPEDAEQNCKKLIPTPVRRVARADVDPDRAVLRFSARFANRADRQPLSSADLRRRFILSFYLSDGCLSIYEPPIPNSGVVGGKFLERCKMYRAGTDGKRRIDEQDLWIGAKIELCGRVFELVDADEATLALLQADTNKFRRANADVVVSKISQHTELAEVGTHGMEGEEFLQEGAA
jgi:EF-hand domain-containing protein 1